MAAAIRTVRAEASHDAARAQWRPVAPSGAQWHHVADGLRQRFERLAQAMASAEGDILAAMTFHPDQDQLDQPLGPAER